MHFSGAYFAVFSDTLIDLLINLSTFCYRYLFRILPSSEYSIFPPVRKLPYGT